MQPKSRFFLFRKSFAPVRLLLCIGLATILNSCFLQFDRTTTIYGTITDQNEKPVDSILVVVSGTRFLTYEDLKEVFTDENGKYEIVLDVPKKFSSSNVTVPFGNDNKKFEKFYKETHSTKDGKATGNCCSAIIGRKTRYDFQLIPK